MKEFWTCDYFMGSCGKPWQQGHLLPLTFLCTSICQIYPQLEHFHHTFLPLPGKTSLGVNGVFFHNTILWLFWEI